MAGVAHRRGRRRAPRPRRAAAASEEEGHPSVCSVCLGLSFDPLALSNCPLSVLSFPHSFSLSFSQYLTPVPHSHLALQLEPWVSGSRAQGLEDGIRDCFAPCTSPSPVSFLSVSLPSVTLLDRVLVLSQSAPLLCWVPSKPSGLGMGERGVLRRGGAPMGPP